MSGAVSVGTIATVAGIGAAGAIGGAAISAHAAGKAADVQASAADRAAQLQYQASQDALAFQKQQWNTQQQNLAPWLQSGEGALSNLNYLLGIGGRPQAAALPSNGTPVSAGGMGSVPAAQAAGQHMVNPQGTVGGYNPFPSDAPGSAYGQPPYGGNPGGPALGAGAPTGSPAPAAPGPGATAPAPSAVNTDLGGYGSLMQGYDQTFTAPTAEQARQMPGYQFTLQEGQNAIERSAAARGGVLTGGTAKALDQYSQGLADSNYQNTYTDALNAYNTNYNVWNQGQTSRYDRLASLAGFGQQTAQQLGMLGNQAAQNVSSNLLSTAGQMGQDYQNAAAASASGYVGGANAWSGALTNGTNSLSNLMLLKSLGH